MLKPIDTSKCTTAALRVMGYLPPEQPKSVGTGWVAAINTQCDKPLILEMENGTLFKLGGLSDSQLSQLPLLQEEIIGQKVAFKFSGKFNDLDQPINPVFNTLLLNLSHGGVQ